MDWKLPFKPIEIGKGECLKSGTDIAVISIGTMARNVSSAIDLLYKTDAVGHFDIGFLKPLDEELLHTIFKSYKAIVTVEDGTIVGGLGSAILEFANKNNYPQHILPCGIKDEFIEHGTVEELHALCNIDAKSLKEIFEHLLLNL